jgi:hypothetical protein
LFNRLFGTDFKVRDINNNSLMTTKGAWVS